MDKDTVIAHLDNVKNRALDVLLADMHKEPVMLVAFIGGLKGAAQFHPEQISVAAEILEIVLEDFEAPADTPD